MVIILNVYHVQPYQKLHLGSRFLQNEASWSDHMLPWVTLSGLWLSCTCALDFICFDAINKLHAMDKKWSMAFSLESNNEF